MGLLKKILSEIKPQVNISKYLPKNGDIFMVEYNEETAKLTFNAEESREDWLVFDTEGGLQDAMGFDFWYEMLGKGKIKKISSLNEIKPQVDSFLSIGSKFVNINHPEQIWTLHKINDTYFDQKKYTFVDEKTGELNDCLEQDFNSYLKKKIIKKL